MKKLILFLMTVSAGLSAADKLDNSPRTPERDDIMQIVEQVNNPMLEEIYRRRNNHNNKLLHTFPIPEIKAKSVAQWEKEKAALLKIFEEELYGKLPPAPEKMELKLLSEKPDALNNTAIRREYRLLFTHEGRKFDFDMLLYVPKNAKKPVPVFVGLNFSGNQYNTPEPDVRPTRSTSWKKGRWYATGNPSKTRSKALGAWNYEETIKRGYAVATACYGELHPDNPEGLRKSVYTLFYDKKDLRTDYEIPLIEYKKGARRTQSAISAWAWGMIQMRKALEQIALVDAAKAITVGHSRLGKTSIWAAVNEPAFAGCISNNSGHLGAKLSKRIRGEDMLLAYFAHAYWFLPDIVKYTNNEGELPVDQHMLLAMIAPRGLYVASSNLDYGADPEGEFMSARLAGKIWQLYGKTSLPEKQPPVNTPVGKTLRYHVKTGKHSITPYDWQQYYNFADYLFGK